jgi:hypothetical protein
VREPLIFPIVDIMWLILIFPEVDLYTKFHGFVDGDLLQYYLYYIILYYIILYYIILYYIILLHFHLVLLALSFMQ